MSEQRQARLAFIGAGGFASANIYPAIPMLPVIDLVAVCDIDRAKAERNARCFGARAVYTDLHAMLDTEKPDGVFVIGPAPQQYELAPHVLKRGIPVYTEKPSANTAAEAKELAEIAEANGTWGQCGYMKRFAACYTVAKEILAKPEFGDLHIVNAKFGQGPYPQIWGIDSAKRAFLIGQCCHIFDLCRYFAGDPVSVSALIKQVTDTQFTYLITVEYATGIIGHINLSCLEHTSGFRDIYEHLELAGLGTNITVDDMMKVRWVAPQDWSTSAPSAGRYEHVLEPSWTGIGNNLRHNGYVGEVENFALRCTGERSTGPDLWDSYWSLKFGEAVYTSAHCGGAKVEV